MAKKEVSSKSKKVKNKKKKRKNIFGKVLAGIIAVALLAAAGYAVVYLIQRGQNAMNNYQAPTAPIEATQPQQDTSHTLAMKELPRISSDDKSDGYLDGAVYIWKNKGYEVFKGSVNDAKAYAESVSNYKTLLGKDYNVYSAVVPSAVEIALPERLSKTVSNNQWENISTIFSNLSKDVTPVDVYNTLGEKRNEKLYYNTDKNMTQLGAYYTYTALAGSLGIKAEDIKSFELVTASENVLGSHITATVSKETKNGNPMLLENPDTVAYYSLPESVSVKAMPKASDEITEISYYNSDFDSDSTPADIYNTVDCAYTVLENSNVENGKIAIITDRIGYGVAPFLTANYSEVHLIDIDNFERNVKAYLEENKITDVVYLNGIMSANTAVKTAKTDAMF